uniref:Uncharacterized protein n=1 Tax=Schistosoma japonicum TaxID=6182 RepID=Q5C3A2_SCHJA|nr:unknown [Schistosoma japonicum]
MMLTFWKWIRLTTSMIFFRTSSDYPSFNPIIPCYTRKSTLTTLTTFFTTAY